MIVIPLHCACADPRAEESESEMDGAGRRFTQLFFGRHAGEPAGDVLAELVVGGLMVCMVGS